MNSLFLSIFVFFSVLLFGFAVRAVLVFAKTGALSSSDGAALVLFAVATTIVGTCELRTREEE